MRNYFCRGLVREQLKAIRAEKSNETVDNESIKIEKEVVDDYFSRLEEIALRLLMARIHVDRWMVRAANSSTNDSEERETLIGKERKTMRSLDLYKRQVGLPYFTVSK